MTHVQDIPDSPFTVIPNPIARRHPETVSYGNMSTIEPCFGITLVLGGARSGKSTFAESLARCHSQRVYLATAERVDDEMVRRIEAHRRQRGADWRTVEAPLDLAAAIRRESAPKVCLLVDCLTVWLGNLMHYGWEIDAAQGALLDALAEVSGPVVLVANEVGLGIVPDNAAARAFRDHAGWLNQAVARLADRVYFVAAGLPLLLKGPT